MLIFFLFDPRYIRILLVALVTTVPVLLLVDTRSSRVVLLFVNLILVAAGSVFTSSSFRSTRSIHRHAADPFFKPVVRLALETLIVLLDRSSINLLRTPHLRFDSSSASFFRYSCSNPCCFDPLIDPTHGSSDRSSSASSRINRSPSLTTNPPWSPDNF